jgi:hypothetical protein
MILINFVYLLCGCLWLHFANLIVTLCINDAIGMDSDALIYVAIAIKIGLANHTLIGDINTETQICTHPARSSHKPNLMFSKCTK